MLPFLYPLWYVPTVNVWIWTSQKQQKSSLGRAAPFSFNCSDQSWLLQEPRANSKAHQHIFNVYPAKRTHGTNIKCKNWREDAEKSPTWQARSRLWWATCGQENSLPLREGSSSPKLPETAKFLPGRGYLIPKIRYALQIQKSPVFPNCL